ncbi:hypothetical protein TNCV_2948291 [Trichonephila clavipes]|nr:hypothetical protein TNCV_2948291 [Trichonephila clavipes]
MSGQYERLMDFNRCYCGWSESDGSNVGKNPDDSLIAEKEFRNWVVKDLVPFSQTVLGVKKRHINIVLSFSHDSVTIALLKTYNVHLDIGPHWALEIKWVETVRGSRRTRDQGSRVRQGRQKNKRLQKDD